MQIPEFDIYTPGAEPGWRKTRSEMAFENPHVSVERAWYDTPGGRTDVPWMVVQQGAWM
jgi:hypothetical protein